MSGLLLFNSQAGDGNTDRLAVLREELQPADVWEFGPDDNMAELPERTAATPARYAAVAGCDGTVESAAATLVGSDLALGVIPCGTYNNFAKSLDLPHEIPEACRVIREGHTRFINAGRVNGQLFFESVGIGLDAELFPSGERIKSGEPEQWLEFFAKAHRFPRSRVTLKFPSPIRDIAVKNDQAARSRRLRRFLRSGAKEITLKSLLVAVSNTPLYGANFAIAPDQEPDAGKFTISIFHRHNKLRLMLHFLAIALGLKIHTPDLLVLRSHQVTVQTDKPTPVHVDGNPVDDTSRNQSLEIKCEQNAIRVFTPAQENP